MISGDNIAGVAAILPMPLSIVQKAPVAHRAGSLDGGSPVDLIAVCHPVFRAAGIRAEASGSKDGRGKQLPALSAGRAAGSRFSYGSNIMMAIAKGFHG